MESLRGCNADPCEVLTVHCSLLFKCCDWVCSHFMMRMKCDFRNQLEVLIIYSKKSQEIMTLSDKDIADKHGRYLKNINIAETGLAQW